MIHPRNAQQIESATGLREHLWPEGFQTEYELQLRMMHRISSSGGPLPLEVLIPLMRQFDMQPPSEKTLAKDQVRWSDQPRGTRVEVVIGGHRRKGQFEQAVSGGTLAVRLDGEARVLERPASEVLLDRSIPADIQQATMQDTVNDVPLAKSELLEKDIPTIPVTDWRKVSPGSEVMLVKDSSQVKGILVGPTPKRRKKLTVQIGETLEEVSSDIVQLVDVTLPQEQEA